MKTIRLKKTGLAVSALALGVAGIVAVAQVGFVEVPTPVNAAWAEEDGSKGGPDNARGGPDNGKGKGGAGGQGAQKGQDRQGDQGAGQGGPSADSDGKGPQAGGPSDDKGAKGERPPWSEEGIPEIELGRLSVARSPERVLDRAEAEALANLTGDAVDFYNQSLDDIIYDLSVNWDTISIVDSPLQNLALFRDVLEDGDSLMPGVDDSDAEKLLSVFLGVASDKTVPITTETVEALYVIFSKDLDTMIAIDPEATAEDAEAVRIAVVAGHG